MATLSMIPLPADVALRVDTVPLTAPAELEGAIDAIWKAEQTKRGGRLFNGRTLSLHHHDGSRLHARGVEYRLVLAARLRPDLFSPLGIRPLAVSGLLCCPEGVVFGRRGLGVTQDGGRWELVPSGGLDADGHAPPDIRAQVLTELREEIGLPDSAVEGCIPFCLVEDADTGIADVGVMLRTSEPAAAIARAHADASDEYTHIQVVPAAELDKFIQDLGPALLPVSRLLLTAGRRYLA